MGKASRDKGKRGEREACDVLRSLFPNVRRRAMQSRGGSEGADLDNTPGFHVEVGVGRVNPREKWEQADRDAFAGLPDEVDLDARCISSFPREVPIALTRKDRGEWLVTMSAQDWCELVSAAKQGQEGTQDGRGEEQRDESGKRVGRE